MTVNTAWGPERLVEMIDFSLSYQQFQWKLYWIEILHFLSPLEITCFEKIIECSNQTAIYYLFWYELVGLCRNLIRYDFDVNTETYGKNWVESAGDYCSNPADNQSYMVNGSSIRKHRVTFVDLGLKGRGVDDSRSPPHGCFLAIFQA